ncbi:hypothetical protein like AT1G22160 [Hibiscus trionum]|uniref:FLZ-type domain-containing protein n=1 Tax=Hibiscus trionum TaxID=183268 RepID=A0A9W7LKL6_HIBTR|nr:hypothetical protein like AT1G22160 [Hibiscus trionum]
MLLGKRRRQPMKRTTSMTGINVVDQHPILLSDPSRAASGGSAFTNHVVHATTTAAPFLRSCWLCTRRLAPGRDVYMYRGDTAFCSLECREKQMKKDERKEKKNINATPNSFKEIGPNGCCFNFEESG